MTSPRMPGPGLRVYAVLFVAGLVAVCVALVVLAATASPARRGTFIGLAVLWSAMATGAVLLAVAVERKVRRSRRESTND